jgi:uncharacterized protein with LGFP repeats
MNTVSGHPTGRKTPGGWVYGQGGQLRKLVRRALVSMATAAATALAATIVAAALLAPAALASPIGDAEAAMMAAWDKAGGDNSPLGARKGDVYPVADGFALDFAGGKMFYTTDTGAKYVFGPILDKYESLGGPGGSDLGFPSINEVPGLAGPDSRVATFSATDKPVIFWTPDHGAFVVRGPLNSAWDRLGSSGGVLGAPIGDETYDGDVTAQKFSGGQISWNTKSKEFTTDPVTLADQLKGLQVAVDPTGAINMAWRATGGANGPLGVKQGAQYSIGGDGIVQDFAGGKVYFTPATGANAVESDILAKYESLGGPVGSDLGFPTANEADGGIAPASRVVPFSGADKPVIFWTSDHGAFVIRGAMKAAWDKLRGATGKLGAPVGDQALDGDVVSQKFTGGKISWNRAKNTFTTDPANLAPLLSGLQVAGQSQPSSAAMPSSRSKLFTWHWWYLLALIPLLVLVALLVFVLFGWRRRRRAANAGLAYSPDRDLAGGYDIGDTAADGHWSHDDADLANEQGGYGDGFGELPPPESPHPADAESAARVGWRRGAGAAEEDYGPEDGDQDAIDTTPTPVVSVADFAGALRDEGYPDQGYPEADFAEGEYSDDGYLEEEYSDEGYLDEGYPDVAIPRTPPEAGYAEAARARAGRPDVAHPDDLFTGAASGAYSAAFYEAEAAADDARAAEAVRPGAAAAGPGSRAGRHAAASEPGLESAGPSPAGRPTIHLPLDDPYQPPDGYPIKASARFGLYYTPSSELYDDTIAEVWLSSEEVAEANGFVRAD